MCTCVHVYMRMCVYACMCVCVYVYMRICVHMYMCTYVHAYMSTCVHVYMCTCVHVYEEQLKMKDLRHCSTLSAVGLSVSLPPCRVAPVSTSCRGVSSSSPEMTYQNSKNKTMSSKLLLT